MVAGGSRLHSSAEALLADAGTGRVLTHFRLPLFLVLNAIHH